MGWTRSSKLAMTAARRLMMIGALLTLTIGATSAQSSLIENRWLRVFMFGGGERDNINLSGRFEIQDVQTGETILLASHIGDLGLLLPGSYLTVRIDGGIPPTGTGTRPGWDVVMGDVSGSQGSNAGFTWTRPPVELNGRIFASGITDAPAPPIEINTEITLIGDMARFRFTAVNRDTQPHTVGIRFAQDYQLNGFLSPNTGLVLVPQGPVIPSVGPRICTETDLMGSLVPASWRRSDKPVDPSAPVPSVGGLLRPRNADPTFLPPDRLVVGAVNFTQSLWDFTPTTLPDFDFCRDLWDAAAAIFWNPRVLTPGASQDYITYVGRNRAAFDPDSPLAVAVDGPLSLTNVQGQLQPVPFRIEAIAKNLAGVTLTNITATLTLPPGLELAPNQSGTQTAPTLTPNAEATFQWQVQPVGNVSGRLTYSVSVTAGPGLVGKSVTNEIEIPALPVNQTITLSNPSVSQTGAAVSFVNMVSVPYFLQDASPVNALVVRDETGRQLSYTLGEFGLLRWNDQVGVYEAAQVLRPGEAYWLITSRQASSVCTQLNFKLDANNTVAVSTSNEFDMGLQRGWNQVGNPFLYATRFADLIVVPTEANDPDRLKPLTVEQAAQRGIILPQMYEYDPRTCSYTPSSLGFNTEMIPFRGYWLKSLRPGVRILFRPAVGRSVALSRSNVALESMGSSGWALPLVARMDSLSSSWNSFGVGVGANDGPDVKDIENPPAPAPQLSVVFSRPDWPSGRAGSYMRDIQAADGRAKTWNVIVTTPEANSEITLAWPEINRVPRGYDLYITDKATGQRRSMRQTSSIRVNTGSASTRAFVVSAEPRRLGSLTVSSVIVRSVGRGNSAAISFIASQDANVQVRILKAGGGLLRNLATRSASAGETTVTWDLKDNRGVSVPSGAYTIEVKAATTDGQSARQIAPYLVVR